MKALEMIPQLIRASLEKDNNSVEVISLTLSNVLKNKFPEISDEINRILFEKNIGNNAYRSIGLSDIPTDKKNNESLINVKEVRDIEKPILSIENEEIFENFLMEQKKKYELLKLNLKPTNSILLYGEPGVGKTYSATWLASKLNKPLIALDLATIMSSYLGETGSNIKKVLDYAKENDCILFLDEFDAIAKTRTDNRELGEIKRIVNVLLKELEEWPIGSIIIAATNHEELLDKAIWRRFDLKIRLNLPLDQARRLIINREFSKVNGIEKCSELIDMLVDVLKDENAAEIVRICTEIKREFVLYNETLEKVIIKKIGKKIKSLPKEKREKFIFEMFQKEFSIKEIIDITNLSQSSIYRYINKK